MASSCNVNFIEAFLNICFQSRIHWFWAMCFIDIIMMIVTVFHFYCTFHLRISRIVHSLIIRDTFLGLTLTPAILRLARGWYSPWHSPEQFQGFSDLCPAATAPPEIILVAADCYSLAVLQPSPMLKLWRGGGEGARPSYYFRGYLTSFMALLVLTTVKIKTSHLTFRTHLCFSHNLSTGNIPFPNHTLHGRESAREGSIMLATPNLHHWRIPLNKDNPQLTS